MYNSSKLSSKSQATIYQLVGVNGHATCDIASNKVTTNVNGLVETFDFSVADRNDQCVKLMSKFLSKNLDGLPTLESVQHCHLAAFQVLSLVVIIIPL